MPAPAMTQWPPTAQISSEPHVITNEMTCGKAVVILADCTSTLYHSSLYCSNLSTARFSPVNAFTTRIPGSESVSTEVTAAHLRQILL